MEAGLTHATAKQSSTTNMHVNFVTQRQYCNRR